MVAAKEWQPRGSWRPKKESKKTKKTSYYEFFNWSWPQPGVRGDPVKSCDPSSAELIRTTYFNQANCTYTLHTLAFDLDIDKADRRWVDGSKLDFDKIRTFLEEEEPLLHEAITEIVSSTSGRGLGIAIAVSPSDTSRNSSRKYLRLCRVVQSKIIDIFNYYGMGADTNARGLKREMPNFRNPSKTLYANQIRRKRVDARGMPVVTELLSYANKHATFKSNDHRLWPHYTTERKLAKLYQHLEDHGGVSGGSRSEIIDITGLSISTFYKVVKNPPHWLHVNCLGKGSGYSLWLVDEGRVSLAGRAKDLLDNRVAPKTFKPFEDVPEPSLVQKGERNKFITDVSLRLKWLGWSCEDVVELMGDLVRRIPGSSSSASCRQYANKVASIFRNMPHYRKEASLPKWLERLISQQRNECTKKAKKGGTPEPKAPPVRGAVVEGCFRVVGFDQRIRFGGRFYSVPSRYVGKEVSVTEVSDGGRKTLVIRSLFTGEYYNSHWCGHQGEIVGEYDGFLRSGITPEHYPGYERQLFLMTGRIRYLFRECPGLAESLLSKLKRCSMPLLAFRSCYALAEAMKRNTKDSGSIVEFSKKHKITSDFSRFVKNIVKFVKTDSAKAQL